MEHLRSMWREAFASNDVDEGTQTRWDANVGGDNRHRPQDYYLREGWLRASGMPLGQIFTSEIEATRYVNSVLRDHGISERAEVRFVAIEGGDSSWQRDGKVVLWKAGSGCVGVINLGTPTAIVRTEQTLLHETAHLIHGTQQKNSNHGPGFAKIHAELMAQYLGVTLSMFASVHAGRTASMKDTAYRGVSLPLSDRQGVPILEALVKRQTNVAARLIIDAMAETVKNHWWAAGAQESDEAGRWWTSRKAEAEVYAMGTTDAWMTLAVVMTATFEDAKGQGYNDGTYVWHLPAGHPVTITEFEALLPDDPQHLLDAWRGVISEGNYDAPGTYWDGTWTKLNVPQMRTTATYVDSSVLGRVYERVRNEVFPLLSDAALSDRDRWKDGGGGMKWPSTYLSEASSGEAFRTLQHVLAECGVPETVTMVRDKVDWKALGLSGTPPFTNASLWEGWLGRSTPDRAIFTVPRSHIVGFGSFGEDEAFVRTDLLKSAQWRSAKISLAADGHPLAGDLSALDERWRDECLRQLRMVPSDVVSVLSSRRVKVVALEKATMGERGRTDYGGFYDSDQRTVFVSNKGFADDQGRNAMMVLHELGHALDHAVGWVSKLAPFKALWKDAKPREGSYFQRSFGGTDPRTEMYAEACAAIWGHYQPDGFTVTDDLRTIVNELRHNVHSGEDL